MNETNKHETNPLLELRDGQEISVTFRDGRPQENVLVRRVRFIHMDRLARAWEKEAEEIAVYTDHDAKWVEQLSEESWEQIIQIGRALNEGPFGRWWDRRRKSLAMLGVDLNKIATASANSSSS